MDRVGLGRALGYGARHAAKSLLAAADAATAPNPNAAPNASATAAPPEGLPGGLQSAPPAKPISAGSRQAAARATPSSPAAGRTVHDVLQTAARARGVGGEVARRAGRSFFSPLARFSSVVSLQVTGTFFALIALIMGQALWRSRAALHFGAASAEARRFYVLATVFLVFAYFALSNFLRARRESR